MRGSGLGTEMLFHDIRIMPREEKSCTFSEGVKGVVKLLPLGNS